MTYCAGVMLDRGLVFMSDTRTNAGVDNVAVFRKMFHFETPGERAMTLMTAGNLATTQALISLLEERSKAPAERNPSILEVPSMFQAARLVGSTLREVIRDYTDSGQEADNPFRASVILGGQIAGGAPRLFLIYPEGNFIESAPETPYFQIGETKYGRPILVRAHDPGLSFEDAVKLLLVSFDSTIRANLSVDAPLDLHCYETGSLRLGRTRRIERDDPYFREISEGWSEALREAFRSLPPFRF